MMKLRHRIGLWLLGRDGADSLFVWRLGKSDGHFEGYNEGFETGYTAGFNKGLQSYAVPTDADKRRDAMATAQAAENGDSLYQEAL